MTDLKIKDAAEEEADEDFLFKHEYLIFIVYISTVLAGLIVEIFVRIFGGKEDVHQGIYWMLPFYYMFPIILLYPFYSARRFRRKINPLKDNLFELHKEHDQAKKDIHEILIAQTLGIESNEIPLRRFIPLRVYTSSERNAFTESIFESLAKFTVTVGFEGSDEYPSISGSWFKKWLVRATELLTSDQVKERLEKGERALNLAYVNKTQSEIDKNQSEAASNLLKSLENVEQAACQIGSILVIKLKDKMGKSLVFTRSLSQNELVLIEQNQNLLMAPDTILETLEKLNRKIEE